MLIVKELSAEKHVSRRSRRAQVVDCQRLTVQIELFDARHVYTCSGAAREELLPSIGRYRPQTSVRRKISPDRYNRTREKPRTLVGRSLTALRTRPQVSRNLLAGGLDVHNARLRKNLLQRNYLATIGPRAAFGHLAPGIGRLEVRRPEWPSAALPRPDVVNAAFAAAAIEENAVAAVQFQKTAANADIADEPAFEQFDRQAQLRGDLLNLGLVDPNVSRGASAAIATARTCKTKSGRVPRLIRHQFTPERQ